MEKFLLWTYSTVDESHWMMPAESVRKDCASRWWFSLHRLRLELWKRFCCCWMLEILSGVSVVDKEIEKLSQQSAQLVIVQMNQIAQSLFTRLHPRSPRSWVGILMILLTDTGSWFAEQVSSSSRSFRLLLNLPTLFLATAINDIFSRSAANFSTNKRVRLTWNWQKFCNEPPSEFNFIKHFHVLTHSRGDKVPHWSLNCFAVLSWTRPEWSVTFASLRKTLKITSQSEISVGSTSFIKSSSHSLSFLSENLSSFMTNPKSTDQQWNSPFPPPRDDTFASSPAFSCWVFSVSKFQSQSFLYFSLVNIKLPWLQITKLFF